jgi:hypothetical protein
MVNLKGKVIDKKSSRPIQDVVVLLRSKNAVLQSDIAQTTNCEGCFLWKNLVPCKYELRFIADGYHPKKRTLLIQEETKDLRLLFPLEKLVKS